MFSCPADSVSSVNCLLGSMEFRWCMVEILYEACLKCATSGGERGKGLRLNIFHEYIGYNCKDWRTRSSSVEFLVKGVGGIKTEF